MLLQVDRLLDHLLLSVVPDLCFVSVFQVLLHELAEGLPGEPTVMTQVAARDQFPFRVPGEPVAASSQEFVDLVRPSVVLVIVEHGQKDEEMLSSCPSPRPRAPDMVPESVWRQRRGLML